MMSAETNSCPKCDCGTDSSRTGSLEFGRHAMTHFSHHFSLLELLLALCSLSLLGGHLASWRHKCIIYILSPQFSSHQLRQLKQYYSMPAHHKENGECRHGSHLAIQAIKHHPDNPAHGRLSLFSFYTILKVKT